MDLLSNPSVVVLLPTLGTCVALAVHHAIIWLTDRRDQLARLVLAWFVVSSAYVLAVLVQRSTQDASLARWCSVVQLVSGNAYAIVYLELIAVITTGKPDRVLRGAKVVSFLLAALTILTPWVVAGASVRGGNGIAFLGTEPGPLMVLYLCWVIPLTGIVVRHVWMHPLARPDAMLLGVTAASALLFGVWDVVSMFGVRHDTYMSHHMAIPTGVCFTLLQARSMLTKRKGMEQEVLRSSTDLQAAEAQLGSVRDALREGEAHYQLIFNALPHAMLVEQDARVLLANAAAAELLAMDSAAQLKGVPVNDLVVMQDREQLEAVTRQVRSAGGVALARWRMARKDGAAVDVEVSSQRMALPGGEAVLHHVRDLTEQKRLQQQLIMADRLASLGTLAAGVAHEINNPLTFIQGNMDLMHLEASARAQTRDASAADKETLAMVEDVRTGVQRVQRIVADLRVFSRADGGGAPRLDVRKPIRQAVKLAQVETRHRARLVEDLQEVPHVSADESRVAQVVLNLIINAAQAIPPGRAHEHAITVRTRLGPGNATVVMEVEDTGIGIPEDVQDRIFDPFFTTKPPGEGTGLGLSICHGLVTAMGGGIQCISRPGEGTLMRVTLPSAPAPTPPVPTMVITPGPLRRLRILVVDDEPLVLRAVVRLLGAHQVVTLESGRAALDLLATDSAFDAILMDLMMPEITGVEVYEVLQDQSPHLLQRVALMTGGSQTESMEKFLQTCAQPHLQKPLDRDRLHAMLAILSEPPAPSAPPSDPAPTP
jgi:PAS domain S-box-containing protein